MMEFVSGRPCSEGHIKCNDGLQCIPDSSMCDGWARCNDESDEDENFCKGETSYICIYKCTTI